MGHSSLKEQTAKGLFWGAFSHATQQIVAVAFGIWLARLLNADDYGLVGMLAIFVALGNIIVNSGFVITLTNKPQVSKKEYDAVFWFSVFAGAGLYLILYFLAPYIALFYERPELTRLSRILFLSIFINGLGMVSHTVLFKNMLTKQRSIVDTVSVSGSFLISLIVALQGYAYWAIVTQRLAQCTIATLLRFYFAPWLPGRHIHFGPLKELFPFSSKLFLASLFTETTNNLFSVLLGKFYHAQQVGYYTQGQKWTTIGSQLTGGMVEYVAQPTLVQVNDDKSRQLAVLRKFIRLGAFVSFPLLLGLAFVGQEFVQLALGSKWLPSVLFLQLFCIWGSMRFLWVLYSGLVYTRGKANLHLYSTLATGVLQFIAIIGGYKLGIFPMLIAYITASFIGLFIWQHFVKQLIGLGAKQMLSDIAPYLGITLLCFGFTWLVTKNISNLYLLLVSKILLSAGLYLGILKYSKSVIFAESLSFLQDKFQSIKSKNERTGK